MADEREVTSDESAAAEPVTDWAESTEQVPETEPEASITTKGDSGEAGCPIRMDYLSGLRCGRRLHFAPEGGDEKPVCLMHSKDPHKHSGPLFDKFWREFERILEDAGENVADFDRFVFPHLDLIKRQFEAICRFDHATFTREADFSEATFTRGANFYRASFRGDANFCEATFAQDADFRVAAFKQNADFSGAKFVKAASFSGATFAGGASFLSATFSKNAIFPKATFTQGVGFNDATFAQNANFYSATFAQMVRFGDTKFGGTANWRRCRFLDQVEFRSTSFGSEIAGEPGAVFVRATFSKPGETVFDNVDLSRALFHSCDVSQVWFTSSVHWNTRKNNRGLAVFEESIPLGQEFGVRLERDWQRDYRAVAQIYQQLKKNYDSRLDYWTANEFHFGEMEMKRLAGPTRGRPLGLRQWLHRNLSLVALYRWASDYGNSYGKPMVWLLGILLLFAALLPAPGVGLKRQGAKDTETYVSVWDFQKTYAPNLQAEARLFGKGAITSVDTATFQKSAEYAPAYPWGRVLAIFETLLTSSLFALFLLAIRRQFRR
ncbi:MAG: pentapeptide repeat-containing protein [Terracidiphilus sp.]|jgi:uncharacterized protein YjbI with pentapeptide repeats